jgi:ZipA, C-terminal FtsZ-binding domain
VLTLTFDSQAALADDPNLAAVREVTLAFDVPQTDPKAAPFATWQSSAQALAQAMDATVVDDHGRALGAESFAAIGNELGQLYAALEARDLAAGSPAARRLFS